MRSVSISSLIIPQLSVCVSVLMLSVSFHHLQRRWGITVRPDCPVTSPSATSSLSRMKTSCLKWRICIHSTSNSDSLLHRVASGTATGLLCKSFLVLNMTQCVCVLSQGVETEWGGAVFPQHSTDAGVVWSGAACCHGRVSTIKLLCDIIQFNLLICMTFSVVPLMLLSVRTPTTPLWWWV